MNGRAFTATEIKLVREIYPDVPGADLAALLQRPIGSVYQMANKLGIHKSEAFWRSDYSSRVQRGKQLPGMVANQFKPGLVPWNKGVKGVTGTHPESRRTQFKKGQRPHTWLPVGSYRITTKDQYLERKVNDRPGNNSVRWKAVHRLVWEAAHGPVPASHIVVFRPGLKTTVLEKIVVERLECITRAENARRNNPRNKHPELGRLIQLKGVIPRHINRIARQAQEQAQP